MLPYFAPLLHLFFLHTSIFVRLIYEGLCVGACECFCIRLQKRSSHFFSFSGTETTATFARESKRGTNPNSHHKRDKVGVGSYKLMWNPENESEPENECLPSRSHLCVTFSKVCEGHYASRIEATVTTVRRRKKVQKLRKYACVFQPNSSAPLS